MGLPHAAHGNVLVRVTLDELLSDPTSRASAARECGALAITNPFVRRPWGLHFFLFLLAFAWPQKVLLLLPIHQKYQKKIGLVLPDFLIEHLTLAKCMELRSKGL